MTETFYSHGKLLLTSEYLVLDGATALAVPTNRGQKMTTTTTGKSGIHWKSILVDGSVWFETHFNIKELKAGKFESENPIITTLGNLLLAVQKQDDTFLDRASGSSIVSNLEFPRNWGLGSSSTLIANIAQWSSIDAYTLLAETFGGSGYDIACASAKSPITFKRDNKQIEIETAAFDPSFKEQIFFVHLNKKQNSRDSITHYRNIPKANLETEISYFSKLTQRFIDCDNVETFEALITEHEERLSSIIKTATVKSRLFSDYNGAVKSLGGWGGDFVMITGNSEGVQYFKRKGYNTILSFEEMMLP